MGETKLLLVMFMLTGFTLLIVGSLLAYYFNSITSSMLPIVRLIGLTASLALVLVGMHLAVASIYSLKRTRS
ncbi:MAG TPA: hypothetical protein EYH26_00280 [Pyrodictium sp.]|nr:hypothetical protein [Pyrodictium sp.]